MIYNSCVIFCNAIRRIVIVKATLERIERERKRKWEKERDRKMLEIKREKERERERNNRKFGSK